MNHVLSHRVQFYETDLMGIVHHSNYLRFCEEARVQWAVDAGILQWTDSSTALQFSVLKTEVVHLRPCRFGDLIEIELQARLVGVRIEFHYKLWNQKELVCEAKTSHVALGRELKPQRPSSQLKRVMEKQKWNETWLSNLSE